MRAFPLLQCTVFVYLLSAPLAAAEAKREAVAKVVTDSGTFVAREDIDKPWKVLRKNEDVPSEDLIIGLTGAMLTSKNGAVKLTTQTDLSNRSPLPVIEAAVRLHASKDADLDLTLDRGRIELENTKAKGAARAIVRFRTRIWTLSLDTPGTRVSMEIYGRWPEGTRFVPDAKLKEGPLTSVQLFVHKGEINRACSFCQVSMSAPPGPARFSWDSINGDDSGPKKLEALPEWLKEPDLTSTEGKKKLALREQFRAKLVERGLGEAILMLLESPDAEVRRLGVYALGAFDQLPSLADYLTESKDPDAWNNAVVAMRHWLGRDPGQAASLFRGLVDRQGFKPVQARNVVQLLMGFSEEDRQQPQLYQHLIEQLRHEKLVIRGLAYWHLRRLAPAVKVAYNPAGDAEEWNRALDAYKKAIPAGKVPAVDRDGGR